MNKTRTSVLVFLFLFGFTNIVLAETDMSVLGIRLGDSVNINMCPKSNLKYNFIDNPRIGMCIDSIETTSLQEKMCLVNISRRILPEYACDLINTIIITLFLDKVSSIEIDTSDDSDSIVNDLKVKYGKPNIKTHTIQNDYGATYYIHDYTWSNEKLSVLFRDYRKTLFGTYYLKGGQITITTNEYLDFLNIRNHEKERNKPKL